MELYFSDKYDESSLFLLEVPPIILDYIKNDEGELLIKGSDLSILCTKSKKFELKFLETSNTFMILDSENESSSKKEITLMTYHTLECCDLSPRKYYIYNLLKRNCSLSYDLSTGSNNFSSFTVTYTKEDLFTKCDLPREPFEQLLIDQNIFLYNNKYMVIFEMAFSFDIVVAILRGISYSNKDIFSSCDDVLSIISNTENGKYDKCIEVMSFIEKKTLLSYICDVDNNEIVSLNMNKAQLFIAKNIFYSNLHDAMDFKLDYFVSLYNNAFELYIPSDLVNKANIEKEMYLQTKDCADNLYEFYKEYDLRFLIGHCVIYMHKVKRCPLIKWIELSDLKDNFEERLLQLYSLKDKWTPKELKLFMGDLEISNLHDRVARVTQSVTEVNLFDKTKNVNYLYYKKNPSFKGK